MRALFRNRDFWLFVAACAASVGVLAAQGRPLEDVAGSFVILALFLPLVALLACARLPVPAEPSPWRRSDGWTLLGLLAWVALFLATKGPLLDQLVPGDGDPRLRQATNVLLKLAAFVALPAAVLRASGLPWTQAGRPSAPAWRLWLCLALMAAAGLLVQALLGTEFRRLLAGGYSGRHVWLGGVLCFAWMTLEAGLVEEFFFRWYLQSRLAAWTGSQVSAVFGGALVFGLAHAPGMVLRGAGAVEGLGESPTLLASVAYVVATQGVAGLAFGVLWARTRSLVLVVALHALIDTLAGTASFMDTWRL